MATRITLTGIKPTGSPHLGNLVGAILPALRLADQPDMTSVFFIADYHALTTIHDAEEMQRLTHEVAAAWLAFGLDPDKVIFYRQSDVPEIFELTWVLSCFTPKGKMNRAHAYKAAMDQNVANGNDADAGIHMGLYCYPVLMSADILMFGSHYVPVGRDQEQHVEIARDIAERFNNAFGPTLTLPEARIDDNIAAIAGIDGRKMSKSYDNAIPLFADPKRIRKLVMKYKTDSSAPEDPKDPDTSVLFHIYREFADSDEVEAMRARYAHGIGWGEVKQMLADRLNTFLAEPRRTYTDLMQHPQRLDDLLAQGAARARALARPILDDVRRKVGMHV
jgi:tryptophanyl-tRNA synthetase